MKTPVLYRFVLVGLVMALPLFGSAKQSAFCMRLGGDGFEMMDSIPRRQRPQKPEESKPDDDRIRPDIKEVPRSRRLPKPTTVTERVRIKRPPVRVLRPGRVGREIGIH